MVRTISVTTPGQGLHLITSEIARVVTAAVMAPEQRAPALDIDACGLCTVFLQHTSASLLIQENADPSARHDLESWMNALVPENNDLYTHTDEGPDDMPSHIKATLTQSSLSIPIVNGKLALGRWQGIYLWEHRAAGHERKLVVHVGA